jgi:integrase
VWTDPFTEQRCNRRYPTRDVADEWFTSTVQYVKEGQSALPFVDQTTDARARTVAALFRQLDARWERERRSERYRESRAGIFRTWIAPVIGDRLAAEWGADEEVCAAILDGARALGRRPATVQNIGSLMRNLVSTAHTKKWMPRTMNPMAGVSYAAKKEAEDESTDYVPPSERPTTEMVEALASVLAAVGAPAGRAWLGLMARVAGYGGLRLGELASLRPMDVDEKRHGVNVDWAWAWSKRKGAQRKRPKNGRRRFVLLPGSVMRPLVEHARVVAEEHGPAALLFPSRHGHDLPLLERELRPLFLSTARKAGWPCRPDKREEGKHLQRGAPLIPWRNLRHHAATWMFEVADYEWVDVSRSLGHASVAFTQAKYVRPSAEAEKRNCAKVRDL